MSEDHRITERTQLSAPQDVVNSIWDKFATRNPGFILQGRYLFHLELEVKQKGSRGATFIAGSGPPLATPIFARRSVNIDTSLERGLYEVQVKVTAVERGVMVS